eukprot:CAMPEP_0116845452 /NCGR_PEP_ID=MMETSP0418-20121206/13274_1 /TAXON_ID=1158023 /ORGANISM="Astrosyne radiata, Strain 13vi08-1A" /LENGTH=198 /DNA_ID=CAMNT_0004476563 /DNA_START=58 /DNA_END=654 /DNA_ORIENTATION=+
MAPLEERFALHKDIGTRNLGMYHLDDESSQLLPYQEVAKAKDAAIGSSLASTNTESVGRRRHRVQFSDNYIVHDTLSLSEYSKQERIRCFYSDREIQKFEERTEKLANHDGSKQTKRRWFRRRAKKMSIHEEYMACQRGLENLSFDACLASLYKTEAALNAVLDMQDEDPDFKSTELAAAYAEACRDSKKEAVERAIL